MRFFNQIRLAYIDDLANDPAMDKYLSDPHRFIYNLEASVSRWDKDLIATIPELRYDVDSIKPSGGNFVHWGYFKYSPEYANGRLGLSGSRVYGLGVEGGLAIWDTKTKTVVFVHRNILAKINSDTVFEKKFFADLAEALDEELK